MLGDFKNWNCYIYADNVRGAIGQDIRGDGSNALRNIGYYGFQAVNSAGDSLLRAATTGPYSLVLSASATFNDTMIDATKKGASTEEAILLGVLNAGIETATEKIPLDNLLDNLGKNPGNWWNILMKAGGQGLIECSTEELSFIGTTLTEAAILRQNSGYATIVRELRDSGLSEQEAIAKANLQVLGEAKEIAITSMLSGEMSSVGSSVIGAMRNPIDPNTVTPPDIDLRRDAFPEQAGTPEGNGWRNAADLGQTGQIEQAQGLEKENQMLPENGKNLNEIKGQTEAMGDGNIQKIIQPIDNNGKMKADESNEKSIKEQLKEHQSELNKMKPVVNICVPVRFAELDKAGKLRWIKLKLMPTNFMVNRKNMGVIQFEEKQINNAFRYFGNGSVEEAAFEALPYVLEHGQEIDTHPNHKDRGYGTFTIAAPVVINGKRGNMGVVIRQTTKNFYKVHRILTPDGKTLELWN